MKKLSLILMAQILASTAFAEASYTTFTEKDVYHCTDLDGGSKFNLIIYTDMDGEKTASIQSNRIERPIDIAKISLTQTITKNQFRFYYLVPGSDEQVVFCTYDKQASSPNRGIQ